MIVILVIVQMLEVCDLGVRYRETLAVWDVSFLVPSGQIMGLLGPNGAGKSTLFKAMLGLIPVTRGRVLLEGQPLKQQLQRVAYVPQRSQIDWDYPVTVEKVVMMGRTRQTGLLRQPSRQSREIVKSALERVGMRKYSRCQIGELSGGQQQRVFLARAIAQEADLFFFDEPFTGVDRQTEDIMFEVFAELKTAGKSLLIINHDFGASLDYYDRLLLLNQQLIAIGSKEEVFTVDNLKQAYGKRFNLRAA